MTLHVDINSLVIGELWIDSFVGKFDIFFLISICCASSFELLVEGTLSNKILLCVLFLDMSQCSLKQL